MLSSSFATTSHETLKIDDFRPLEKPLEFFSMKFDLASVNETPLELNIFFCFNASASHSEI
jgi:hypothetical protein